MGWFILVYGMGFAFFGPSGHATHTFSSMNSHATTSQGPTSQAEMVSLSSLSNVRYPFRRSKEVFHGRNGMKWWSSNHFQILKLHQGYGLSAKRLIFSPCWADQVRVAMVICIPKSTTNLGIVYDLAEGFSQHAFGVEWTLSELSGCISAYKGAHISTYGGFQIIAGCTQW